MKFRKLRKYRRIFYLVGAIIFVVIFAILQSNYKNTICTGINVIVLDSTEGKYVTQSTILDYIYKNIEIEISGNKFKNFDLAVIEKKLKNDYFIKEVNVYRTKDGLVEIKIKQKKPLSRIYNDEGEDFYIDTDGHFLPTSKNYASYVPIFNGNIPKIDSIYDKNINDECIDTSIYKQIFKLSNELTENEFTRSMIDQIYVTAENEFIMIPKVGDFKIIFGTNEHTKIKFRNLKVFYTEASPKVGWDKYSAINLKYINQIVCTKK